MTPQDWAAWVQAVGSIVAIYGSFRIASRQHKQERAADRIRRDEEKQDDLDSVVQARTLAIRNVVQVATHALQTAEIAIGHCRAPQAKWEAEPFLSKMDQLRMVLDSLITPTTEHLAVLSALQISQMLVLTSSDMRNLGGAMNAQLLERSTKRIEEGYVFLGRLIELQRKLDDLCRERGIPLAIEDLTPHH